MSKSYKNTQIFTPEWVTQKMLDMLDKDCWKDHKTYLFEPSCGDGEMLIVCLKEIYSQLCDVHNSKERAMAETIFKFFAVEIDPEMTVKCRERIWNWIAKELKDMNAQVFNSIIVACALADRIRNQDFFEFINSESIDKIRLMK